MSIDLVHVCLLWTTGHFQLLLGTGNLRSNNMFPAKCMRSQIDWVSNTSSAKSRSENTCNLIHVPAYYDLGDRILHDQVHLQTITGLNEFPVGRTPLSSANRIALYCIQIGLVSDLQLMNALCYTRVNFNRRPSNSLKPSFIMTATEPLKRVLKSEYCK